MSKPVYRLAARNAYCRSCDKVIKRDVDFMITLHSFRNTGQNIHICTDCVKLMYGLLPDE